MLLGNASYGATHDLLVYKETCAKGSLQAAQDHET